MSLMSLLKTMIARFQYTEQRKVAYFQKGFCWLM